ncbi:hypothetical protein H0H92_006672, partial [Tricholoma furcatifolium]
MSAAHISTATTTSDSDCASWLQSLLGLCNSKFAFFTMDLLVFDGEGDMLDLSLANRTYRVQKATLKEHSEVFADMFSVAVPDISGAQVPVVALQDEPDSLELLLH